MIHKMVVVRKCEPIDTSILKLIFPRFCTLDFVRMVVLEEEVDLVEVVHPPQEYDQFLFAETR